MWLENRRKVRTFQPSRGLPVRAVGLLRAVAPRVGRPELVVLVRAPGRIHGDAGGRELGNLCFFELRVRTDFVLTLTFF